MHEPEILKIKQKKLVGIQVQTTLADDKTSLLWNRFMKLKGSIENTLSEDLFSVQIYDETFITENFNSQSGFEKWAAMEVSDFKIIHKGLQKLELAGGEYAVFTHTGTANEFSETARFIFEEWLNSSKYQLDNRPHFEVLGKEYKGPENPESKEKIWIPVKLKK